MPVSAPDHAVAVDAIYRAAASPQLWPDTLTLLADYVGAIGGLVAYANPAEPSSGVLVTGRLRDDLTRLYLERYVLNPYARAMAKAPVGQVQVTSRLVEAASIRRTAYHADILVPQAIEDHVQISHPSLTRNGSSGGIAFPLNGRQSDEIGEAIARLRRLAPHLARAIDFNLQLGRQENGMWQVQHILDAMPSAAVLINRKGGIIRMNAAADALLGEADGISIIKSDGLRLNAHVPAEARMLAASLVQALAVARRDDQGFNDALRISRASGRPPLLVLITPLPPSSFALWEAVDGGARAMVQIVDVHAPASAQAESLRMAAGLTAAEARVAALIGGGLTTLAAAAVLGISANTVKTHLQRCFDKTGVRSQVALARLLASIPVRASDASEPMPKPLAALE
jgi:DNA-binding CsgD family transcriptional regulator